MVLVSVQFSSVAQSCPTLCDPMICSTPGLPVPSPVPEVYPNSCPLSWWCHPTIPSSVVPFSSCPQSFSASGSFPMSQLFASGGQIIGVSASTSVLPMNTQDWSPLGWTYVILFVSLFIMVTSDLDWCAVFDIFMFNSSPKPRLCTGPSPGCQELLFSSLVSDRAKPKYRSLWSSG